MAEGARKLASGARATCPSKAVQTPRLLPPLLVPPSSTPPSTWIFFLFSSFLPSLSLSSSKVSSLSYHTQCLPLSSLSSTAPPTSVSLSIIPFHLAYLPLPLLPLSSCVVPNGNGPLEPISIEESRGIQRILVVMASIDHTRIAIYYLSSQCC